MCVGDWRLGRLVTMRFTPIVFTAQTFIIPSSQQRVYLSVSSGSTTDVFNIQTNALDGGHTNVFVVQTPVQTWTVTAQNDGGLPTLSYRLFGLLLLSGPVTVIEGFLAQDILDESLARLARGDALWPK